ncbi:unnamed protein product [Linum trigynum]|uniref:Uncharacterized protein n=1 Tax=Linum trigynum TaxID=586398 RepID=A0AAV2DSS5_9ROSI
MWGWAPERSRTRRIAWTDSVAGAGAGGLEEDEEVSATFSNWAFDSDNGFPQFSIGDLGLDSVEGFTLCPNNGDDDQISEK